MAFFVCLKLRPLGENDAFHFVAELLKSAQTGACVVDALVDRIWEVLIISVRQRILKQGNFALKCFEACHRFGLSCNAFNAVKQPEEHEICQK